MYCYKYQFRLKSSNCKLRLKPLLLWHFLVWWKWKRATGHHSESYCKAAGWRFSVKQPYSPCPYSLWGIDNMAMRVMNSESLGRLSSCLCVCVCVHACPAALLATAAITEQYHAAWHTSWICTHLYWERRPVPMRQRDREKQRRKGEEGKRRAGDNGGQRCHSQEDGGEERFILKVRWNRFNTLQKTQSKSPAPANPLPVSP